MDTNTTNIFGEEVDLTGIKTPYQLYRRMRPYYFSDSKKIQSMSRDQFDYYMSQLSKDRKQDLFEEFTRQLVVRLITPNIVPQTGPTGGGDGGTWITFIETCKLQKKAALDFFQEFFKKITKGRADYELIAQEVLGKIQLKTESPRFFMKYLEPQHMLGLRVMSKKGLDAYDKGEVIYG